MGALRSRKYFPAFIARLQQRLLNEGKADRGIIAVDTFDYDILDKIYAPYDNLTMLVLMNADATWTRRSSPASQRD